MLRAWRVTRCARPVPIQPQPASNSSICRSIALVTTPGSGTQPAVRVHPEERLIDDRREADRKRVPIRQRHDRVDLLERAALQVEALARAGNVRHHEVEGGGTGHVAVDRVLDAVRREAEAVDERAPAGRLAAALAIRHRHLHVVQTPQRVGLVAGQVDEHERDRVAGRGGLVAHADGDHRLELGRLLAALLEEAAHRSRRDREHDVVDGGPMVALDLLQITEGARRAAEAARRREGVVQQGLFRRGRQRVGQRPGDALGVARIREQLPRRAGDAGGQANQVELVGDAVAHAFGQQRQRAWRRLRAPLAVPIVRLVMPLWIEVEQQRHELHRRETIDQAVMNLADEADAPVAHVVGDPQFPQRSACGRAASKRPSRRACRAGASSTDARGGGCRTAGRPPKPGRAARAARSPASAGNAARARGAARTACGCRPASAARAPRGRLPSRPSRRACGCWNPRPQGTRRRAATALDVTRYRASPRSSHRRTARASGGDYAKPLGGGLLSDSRDPLDRGAPTRCGTLRTATATQGGPHESFGRHGDRGGDAAV